MLKLDKKLEIVKKACEDKKGMDLKVLNISKLTTFRALQFLRTDYICNHEHCTPRLLILTPLDYRMVSDDYDGKGIRLKLIKKQNIRKFQPHFCATTQNSAKLRY